MDAVTRLAPAAQWNGTRVPHLNRYLPLSLAPWVALICLFWFVLRRFSECSVFRRFGNGCSNAASACGSVEWHPGTTPQSLPPTVSRAVGGTDRH